MTIFDVLTMIGGLCLFLFGMNVMGDGLERRAGNSLKTLLGKLTDSKIKGFLTGLGVTAVIQSSSATTVMVVGFVNSRLMTLKQSIGVIMGANIGTTVTAWILSLGGISSDSLFMQLLKPTSFTPVLALIGTVFLMFSKSTKQKDVGTILLGFATLMFGMDTMSGAVSGLADIPAFQNLFLMFENPILGVLMIGGISNMGVIDALAQLLAKLGAGNPFLMYTIIVWASVLISAFIDNIPYVATMIPVIAGIAMEMGIDSTALYFGLLSGATLGGNCTPIGASANIAGIGILRKEGYEVSNGDFFKIGIPFTLAAIVPAYILVWILFGV